MNPVKGMAMISFIEWVDRVHPEIQSLRRLKFSSLLSLVNEFEGGELDRNLTLKRKWEEGFKYSLFQGNTSWEQYDIARNRLDEFENDKLRTYRDDLKQLGIKEKDNCESIDYLERRKAIPLRAMFLFTSEDWVFDNYIKQNYAALNSISANNCDIYCSIDQLFQNENAYDQIEEVQILKAMNMNYAELPGIIFWNREGESEFISFYSDEDGLAVKRRLRLIFDEIRLDPSMASVKKIKDKIGKNDNLDIMAHKPKKDQLSEKSIGNITAGTVYISTGNDSVQTVNSGNHANINIAKGNKNEQSTSFESREDLGKFMGELKSIFESALISKEEKEDILNQIALVEAQLDRPEPRHSLIKVALNTIHGLAMGVAGNVLSPVIIERLSGFISTF